jgi:hypothetical protein
VVLRKRFFNESAGEISALHNIMLNEKENNKAIKYLTFLLLKH